MKHHKIEGIIKKRFEKLNAAFDQVRLHFKEDDIRLFRVKIKKLQACLLLLGDAKDHHQALRLPRKITVFYKLCGAIRTLQLQETQILKTLTGTDIKPPEYYLQSVSDKILHLREKATVFLSRDEPFGKEEAKLLELLPRHYGSAATGKLLTSEGTKLKKMFAPVFPSDAALHEIRRTFKNLLYLSPYITTDIGVFLPYSLLSTTAQIDSFTAILGDFHDLNIAIECLHTECQDIEVNEVEKAVLRNIEDRWMTEKNAAHREIYNQMQRIIASRLPSAPPAK